VPTQNAASAIQHLAEKFQQLYGTTPQFVRAPGRVNLIGEHTDYNDGFVLPAAIQMQTTVGAAPKADGQLILFSNNYNERVQLHVDALPATRQRHWSDYVVGVARELIKKGIRLPGACLLIDGDVPEGAGLSSSASLEVAVCGAFLALARAQMAGAEMALLCQRAENDFVGARCGIMDQFVSVHGKKDQALLLDCRSLEYRHQPILEDVRLVICNTMVRHSVAGGEYNQRRRECEMAAEFFARVVPGAKALRDVSLEDFEKHGAALPDIVQKRSRHVITEDARVIEAGEALTQCNLQRFGELMRESHTSLRDDFQVSCAELDIMVELAMQVDGVYGARMTGGGFGGCTINLVESQKVETFKNCVMAGYEKATGRRAEIYVCTAGDGVSVLADVAR
jgi:galactokinase